MSHSKGSTQNIVNALSVGRKSLFDQVNPVNTEPFY
jgi:hypothetical protein